MTIYDQLKLEIDGIEGTIITYTSDHQITNCLTQLKKKIEIKNKDGILYCLRFLQSWYNQNLNEIMQNRYCSEAKKKEHLRSEKLISTFVEELANEDPSTWKEEKEITDSSGQPIIFLSHRSTDKKYADALRNFIVGLGVPEDALVYTSHPLHKIPLGRNIYDYLRDKISGNVFVIILWSNAYLDSPACLNEMGAAWVAQKDYTSIYVPDFDFGNPKYHECAVDTRKMGAVLNGNENCKTSMIEFKNKIESLFELCNDDIKMNYLLDSFIKEIS